ncbi:hypothetical protein JCM3765_006368 [Sporobolomyces pararoseus]
MRSFLVAVFALAFAATVLANPNPEPEPEPHVVVKHPICGGYTFGWCETGLTCQKGKDNKYCCKPPPPPVCGGYTFGTCPHPKICKKAGKHYSCVAPPPKPSGKLHPKREPEPEPYHRARCGGKTLGFCPSNKSCVRGHSGYYCKSGPPPPRPAGPSPSARHHKRSAFCEDDAVACPVKSQLHGFECVQIKTNIEQCGDCAVLGGVDCSALPGVAEVACVNGYCRVDSCTSGYVYDFRKRSCIPNSFWNVQGQQPTHGHKE